MKHGKRPKLKQKLFLKANKLNPDNWLVVKDTLQILEIVHRESNNKKVVEKNRQL